jgi:hypothetical protein
MDAMENPLNSVILLSLERERRRSFWELFRAELSRIALAGIVVR